MHYKNQQRIKLKSSSRSSQNSPKFCRAVSNPSFFVFNMEKKLCQLRIFPTLGSSRHFLTYANILKIKRIKRYHIKGIGSPLSLLISINIDQETEK